MLAPCSKTECACIPYNAAVVVRSAALASISRLYPSASVPKSLNVALFHKRAFRSFLGLAIATSVATRTWQLIRLIEPEDVQADGTSSHVIMTQLWAFI